MGCVPCQVIQWNNRLESMTKSVTTLAEIRLSGGEKTFNDAWARRWYEEVEAACERMQRLVDQITGASDSAGAPPRPRDTPPGGGESGS